MSASPRADASALAQTRFAQQRPEPERFWVRYAPRGWEGPPRLWLDLAAGRLGRPGRGASQSPGEVAFVEMAAGPSGEPKAGRSGEAATGRPDEAPEARLNNAAAPTGRLGAQAGWASAVAGQLDAAAGDPDALAGQPGAAAGPLGDATTASQGSAWLGPAWPGSLAARFDDLVYLPPVPAHLAGERDALARRVLASGAPVLVQLLPGDATTLGAEGSGTAGLVVVTDLLAALLGAGTGPTAAEPTLAPLAPGTAALARLAAVGAAAAAVWPLVPGLTDDPALWQVGCSALATAGLRVVQAVVPALAVGDRRRLAEEARPQEDRREEVYGALFHRPAPSEREFARLAWRHGLDPFLRRPLPRPPLLGAESRRAAGLLALVAELWLRVGRPVEAAQSLFRAARWLDDSTYDVEALRREGNLAVLTALDPLAREIAAAASGEQEPPLLTTLIAEYVA